MGSAKNEMMRVEGLQSLAMSILVKSKAVKDCEIHGYPIDQKDDQAVIDAYAIGNNMITKGEIQEDRKELSVAIKKAITSAYSECPGCANYKKD